MGSSVQVVTAACCAVYAGAGARAAKGVRRVRVVVRRGVRPMLTHGSGARGVAARYGHATTKLISARVAYYHVNVMLYSTLHMSGHVNVYFLVQWRLSIQNKPFTRELWRHALPAKRGEHANRLARSTAG